MGSKTLSQRDICAFQSFVWKFQRGSRRDFAWRNTKNPYRILVSEVMLQQTQTQRVISKYAEFLRVFPSLRALARAPLNLVLSTWLGLGYNRRAKYLWESARIIQREFGRKVPDDPAMLARLPGIGAYTAHAVCAFAFDRPYPLVETNIRAVVIHHFYPHAARISDSEILDIVTQTFDHKNPREWLFALMDYGAALKQQYRGITKRAVAYQPQSKFKGSKRELRGGIMRILTRHERLTASKMAPLLQRSSHEIKPVLATLAREGLVKWDRGSYSLASA